MTTTENKNVHSIFPPPFKVSEKCKLFDFCTNELGLLLNGTRQAVVGNPLRIASFDELNAFQKTISPTNSASLVEINCSGRYISLVTGANLCIYDLQKGNNLRELYHDGDIHHVAWHRESPWLLASVSADCTLRLWDLRSHPAQIAIRRSNKLYRKLQFSPDCNYIACAGEAVTIFDLTMAQNVVQIHSNSPAVAVHFNPAECLLAVAGEDRTVRFWDVDTGECVTQTPAFDAQIGGMLFEPDGKYLLVGTSKQITSIHWEPFELLSQLNYTQQVNFPSLLPSAQNFSSSMPLLTHGNNGKSTILDMRVTKGQLYQLVIEEHSDALKSSTICLTSLPLNLFEKCGIALLVNTDDTDASRLSQQLSAEEKDVTTLSKVEDDVTPITASSTPGSLLDSIIIENDDEEADRSQMMGPMKLPFSTPSNRKRPPVVVSKNETKSDQRRQHNESPATQANSSSTPNFRRPSDRLGIAHNKNGSNSRSNPNPPSSLIRRGSSLTDVTNCATTTGQGQSLPSSAAPSTMPTSSMALAKSRALLQQQSQFASSTASSSSNASSSNGSTTSSSTGGGGDGATRQRLESEVRQLEEFMQVNPKLKAKVQKLKNDARSLLASLGSVQDNKVEHIVLSVSRFDDPHLLAKLLQIYLRQPRTHTLSMNAVFLPCTEKLLKHRNEAYPQLALDFLEMVLISFGESIRHGLASRDFSIGVDVAAEQRFDRCTKCKNALLQIQVNSAFCIDRMNHAQRRRFENISVRIDDIVNS